MDKNKENFIADKKIVHIGGKEAQIGKKFKNFIFASNDLHFYSHATYTLLKDFEIFDSFELIFTSFWSLFGPLKVGDLAGSKN